MKDYRRAKNGGRAHGDGVYHRRTRTHTPTPTPTLSSRRWAAEETIAHHDDKPLVRAFWTASVFTAVHRGANEVGNRILAGAIDVVVFEIFAHLDPIWTGVA
jgi:hypothetical protein